MSDMITSQEDRLAEEAFAELMRADNLGAADLRKLIDRAGRNYGPDLIHTAYAEGIIDADTVTALIGPAWSSCEFPDRLLDHDTWRWLFDVAGFTVDGVRAPRPLVPVELWRGSVPERSTDWSWTTDRAVAAKFAAGLRGRLPGMVYRLLAPPLALLCANIQRGEAEYVVDTWGLTVTEYQGGGQ